MYDNCDQLIYRKAKLYQIIGVKQDTFIFYRMTHINFIINFWQNIPYVYLRLIIVNFLFTFSCLHQKIFYQNSTWELIIYMINKENSCYEENTFWKNCFFGQTSNFPLHGGIMMGTWGRIFPGVGMSKNVYFQLLWLRNAFSSNLNTINLENFP